MVAQSATEFRFLNDTLIEKKEKKSDKFFDNIPKQDWMMITYFLLESVKF